MWFQRFLRPRRALLLGAGAAVLAELFLGVRAGIDVLHSLSPARQSVASLTSLHSKLPLEDVSFRAEDGLLIRGWYAPSKNDATVILLHGLWNTKESMLPQAEMVGGAGFGVLLFDWRGQGESEGTGATWGVDEQKDLVAALGWLKTNHPARAVGAVGVSMGGMALVEVAARDATVRALVTEGTYPSLRDCAYELEAGWGPLTGYPGILSMKLFGPSFDKSRPIDHLRELHRPLLLIYGSEEHARQYDVATHMYDAADPSTTRLWMVQGAKHGAYAEVDPEGLRTRLVRFFTAALLDTGTNALPALGDRAGASLRTAGSPH
ncbi:MAG TPA: alpha/beta fold hydrolase [Polyangiaceae bacterium]|jgi:dipeptidyl aminopeptidase/acylaminoacyl peptidase|nr:alpha/beta fold hydrolase [Polyangiaceae bacterium]